MLNIGIIGCGYWGPNLLRNFYNIDDSRVITCCDLKEKRLRHMKNLYQSVETTQGYMDIINDDDIDAVVIATPVSTHYELAREALEAGKHVFVEKPLASEVKEGVELVNSAREKGLVLFVGHTFVYTAAVNKIKELINSGELGDIYYINSSRLNLGLFQDDINVMWDLAPHDISIMNYVLDGYPESVTANGYSYIQPGIDDVGFITMKYPGSVVANIHVSWLNPNKIRKTTVVGSNKMLVYDDVSSLEKIRIYDKGVDVVPHYDTFGEFQLSYRYGDISIPKLNDEEPLKVECQHFIDCVKHGQNPRSGGLEGLAIMLALDAAGKSISEDCRKIEIEYPEMFDE